MQKNNPGNGFKIGRVLIANNVCYGNGFSGVHLNECDAMDIVNNTCYNNQFSGSGPNTGISVQEGKNVTILNNISVAINSFNGRAYSIGNSTGIVLSNNLAQGTLNLAADDIDVKTIYGDPLFVNPGAFDFRLRSGSPAIGLADPAVAPTNDFAGVARVSPMELGAFEFQTIPLVAVADSLSRERTTRVAKVPVSTLLNNDLSADHFTLSVTSVANATPAGSTVSVVGGFVVYVAPATNSGNGGFQYTVDDGNGHTAVGMVAVTETGSYMDAAPNSLKIDMVGSDLVVTFVGVPGLSYRVQYSTDASPPYVWNEFVPQAIHVAAGNGIFVHTDVNPPGPIRFYRAVGNP